MTAYLEWKAFATETIFFSFFEYLSVLFLFCRFDEAFSVLCAMCMYGMGCYLAVCDTGFQWKIVFCMHRQDFYDFIRGNCGIVAGNRLQATVRNSLSLFLLLQYVCDSNATGVWSMRTAQSTLNIEHITQVNDVIKISLHAIERYLENRH